VEGVTLPHPWLSLDELTQRVGMSVRNVRFYTSRGLVPPPVRRGRSGYYTADHVARLELVQDLQSHGFTLAAIEKYVAGIPASATPEDIALHRTMLAPWQTEPPVELSREELDRRAGRSLSADDLAVLTALGIVTPAVRGRYRVAVAHLSVGIGLLDLGFPPTRPAPRLRCTPPTDAPSPRSCTRCSRSWSGRRTRSPVRRPTRCARWSSGSSPCRWRRW
jgi:DNA-binding transcriptional MerR regulator